jgi:uncharacterized protein YbaP (TraB family)
MFKFLTLLFTLTASASFGLHETSDSLDNALLWKVSGKGLKKTSWLFGTYHLMNDGFLNTIPQVAKSLKKADAVVGELEISPGVLGELMPMMTLPYGTLDSLLGPENTEKLKVVVQEKTGMPFLLLNKLKPMSVYVMIAAESSKKSSGTAAEKGVPMDAYFQQEAKRNKKPVLALETVKQQGDILFNSTSLERQVELLMTYVEKGDEGKDEESEKLIECYKTQQLNCLQNLMMESDFNAEENAELLNKRNLNWIQPLEDFMKNQSCFVAVGALHLTGESGLIKLLREKGYTVEPVSNIK